ncbi:winged helix-turn-helix transcriptional regulator [Natrialbaceae archaeon A-gly3]
MTGNQRSRSERARSVHHGSDDGPFGEPDVHDRLTAATDIFGRKWSLVIVYELLEHGSLGFSDLEGEIESISEKVLSETLEELRETGLIDRAIVNDRPVRVEYSITDRGRRLQPIITTLCHDLESLKGNGSSRTAETEQTHERS